MALFQRSLILLGLWATLPLAFATEPKLVQLEFNVFALDPIEGLAFQPGVRAAPQTLKFYSTTRSDTYVYRGVPKLVFFQADDPTRKAVATFEVPEGSQRLTLVFLPRKGSEGGEQFRIVGITDELDRIPPGHFAVFNLSAKPYDGRISNRRNRYAPLVLSEAQEGRARVYISLFNPGDAKTVIGGLQFGVAENQRALVLIFPPVRQTSLQPIMRVLTDERPEALLSPKKAK